MGRNERVTENRGRFVGFAAGKLQEFPRNIFEFLEFS
jgi:hypothetical protein